MILNADKVNLNKWMGTAATTADTSTAEASKPFEVPKNIQFTLNTSADQVIYDNVTYNNIKGTLDIGNETITLKDLNMQALDGTIQLNGSYSTKDNKLKPAINLAYQLNQLDVAKTFKAFNTVKYLMPIGE